MHIQIQPKDELLFKEANYAIYSATVFGFPPDESLS